MVMDSSGSPFWISEYQSGSSAQSYEAKRITERAMSAQFYGARKTMGAVNLGNGRAKNVVRLSHLCTFLLN